MKERLDIPNASLNLIRVLKVGLEFWRSSNLEQDKRRMCVITKHKWKADHEKDVRCSAPGSRSTPMIYTMAWLELTMAKMFMQKNWKGIPVLSGSVWICVISEHEHVDHEGAFWNTQADVDGDEIWYVRENHNDHHFPLLDLLEAKVIIPFFNLKLILVLKVCT